jgi:hypothetical protein
VRRVAYIVLVSICVTTSGCGATVHAGHALTPQDEELIRQTQPRASLDVVVPVSSGRRQAGEIVRVLPTGVMIELPSGATEVPLATITEIQVNNHALGALAGAGIGAFAGAATGVGIAILDTRGCSSGPEGCYGRGTAIWFGGIILGLLGGVVGLVVGGVHGRNTTYRFE